ncbi:MAG: tetratricopeptide repeat protein [Gammaproteobacteria bacterium]
MSNPAAAQESCPDLTPYYQGDQVDWRQLVDRLIVLQPRCLQSAEYYALLGAAELNSGYVELAREALERALLLQPDHGAAAIDYAQALYLLGEEFAAIELNAQLLARDDLPPALGTTLQQRHDIWQARTRSSGFVAEMAVGYDDNLNSAPSRSEFTLTLAGGIIEVPLDERFRPISGPYANFRFGGYVQRRSAERTHDINYSIRSRQSEFSDAELLQGDLRYALGIPLRHYRWDLTASTTHLAYGGSPLFTATDFHARLRQLGEGCRPLAELAAQHQLYHQQSFMAGAEFSVTGGIDCQSSERDAAFTFESGLVENRALKAHRPGGDREGWLVRAGWQQRVGSGMLRIQYNLANLKDAEGYSELLQQGARRRILSRQFRVQYLRPLREDLTLQFNLSHQRQGGNLTPFENRGTAADIGLNLGF